MSKEEAVAAIIKFMDKCEMDRAIAFAEWFGDHELDFQPTHIKGTWIGADLEKITTEQLYTLFLTHQSKIV